MPASWSVEKLAGVARGGNGRPRPFVRSLPAPEDYVSRARDEVFGRGHVNCVERLRRHESVCIALAT